MAQQGAKVSPCDGRKKLTFRVQAQFLREYKLVVVGGGGIFPPIPSSNYPLSLSSFP